MRGWVPLTNYLSTIISLVCTKLSENVHIKAVMTLWQFVPVLLLCVHPRLFVNGKPVCIDLYTLLCIHLPVTSSIYSSVALPPLTNPSFHSSSHALSLSVMMDACVTERVKGKMANLYWIFFPSYLSHFILLSLSPASTAADILLHYLSEVTLF